VSSEPLRIADLARPRLPWPLRLGNALGGPLVRRTQPLEADALLEEACRRSGLHDFGEEDFREPLRVFLEAVEREADLSPLGRLLTRGLVLQLLTARLRLQDLVRRHPEIEQRPIERPIVIAGLPRTGTTHLHNLLSQHPALRSLPYWESLEPFPDPREQARGRDPQARIARCRRALRFQDRVMPLFKRMHEMTAEARHEEIQLLALSFSSMLFESSYRVPSYTEWYKGTDQTFAYRTLKRALQALQWLRGPQRWVLKSPQHLEQLGPLLRTFPDARFVQTHRDPVAITASLCTMIAYASRMNARRVDPRAIGRQWAARTQDLLRASVEQRFQLSEDQTFDLHFQEFMKDPLGMAERVCAFAVEPVTEAARAAMRSFLAAHPRGRHGRIAYRLEDLGLCPEERRAALAFYSKRFGVEPEPTSDRPAPSHPPREESASTPASAGGCARAG